MAGVTGRTIVWFEPHQLTRATTSLNDLLGLAVADTADASAFTVPPVSSPPGFAIAELGVMAIDNARADVSRLAREELPGVLRGARPEYYVRRTPTLLEKEVPGPPSAGLVAPQTWALESIGLHGGTAEGAGVLVAVLDTGVRKQAALTDALQARPPVSRIPGVSADDVVGHGTHCVGLVAGPESPSGLPRYGVAPKAQVLSVKIFDGLNPQREVDVLDAIRWAALQGAQVISLSAGRDVMDRVLPEDNALGKFLLKKNVLLLCAAGNASDRSAGRVLPVESPGNAVGIAAVGASTRSRRLWNRSNGKAGFGYDQVDFVAPGVGVPSLDLDGSTTRATGTSVSTPIAAGVAAVLKSRDPALSVVDLLAQMRAFARPLAGTPDLEAVGSGLVQLQGP